MTEEEKSAAIENEIAGALCGFSGQAISSWLKEPLSDPSTLLLRFQLTSDGSLVCTASRESAVSSSHVLSLGSLDTSGGTSDPDPGI